MIHEQSYTTIIHEDYVRCVVSIAYLWCEVLGRAAECSGRLSPTDVLLAETEVGNLDVAVRVEQKILQLEIPVTKET